MKKLMLMFVSVALFADETQKNVNVSKIIACGQGSEKRTVLGIFNQTATYDWYLFDDDVLLIAGEEAYKQEKVVVESTKKNGQIIVTKITMKDNPECVSDFKTGKITRGANEIGEISQGTDCIDLKDFYEAIRQEGKVQVSRTDILNQSIAKHQEKVNHFKRARAVSEKSRNDK